MASSNSTPASALSLYSTCPPGLQGSGCTTATCNSTYVAPTSRAPKAPNTQSCSSCTAGFGGLNCNICQSENSCSQAAAAVGARPSGGVDDLVCYKGPRPISTTHLECDINQPTLKSFYPNRQIKMTLSKIHQSDDTALTGVAAWGGQPGTALSQIWLDGTLQYYCQASNCSSTNSSTPIDSSNAALGSDVWTCDNLKCTCLSNSTLCTGAGGGIAMASIVNSLSGQLSMPCDYVVGAGGSTSAKCQFKGGQLTNYLGPAGLPLENCQFGSCVARSQLQSFWRNETQAGDGKDTSTRLSGPVIGGIAVLAVVVALLLGLLLCGIFQRRRAIRRARRQGGPQPPVGLAWEELDYRVCRQSWSLAQPPSRTRAKAAIDSDLEVSATTPEKQSDDLTSHAQPDRLQSLSLGSSKAAQNGHILRGVSGSVPPGQLVAVLGPSGAGKTTLVELLVGKEKRGNMKGSINATVARDALPGGDDLLHMINDKSSGRRLFAFVDQEDQLPAHSTVREALQFAADLSLPENVSRDEKRGIVQGVITTLGLQAVAESQIGQRGRRGISGGEKRRVSIGIALVARPRILVLDEPLSGLDAYNALRVITALRNLANKSDGATTVLFTLHQPSSNIFHTLDRAIVLSRGGVLYSGSPTEALSWCATRGRPCPDGFNVADHLLTMAFESQPHADASSPLSPSSEDFAVASLTKNQQNRSRRRDDAASTTTWFTQVFTLSRRYLQTARRDVSGPLTHLVGHIIVGLLVGGAFFQVKLSIGGFQNRIGSLYFLYMLMMFASMSAMTLLHSVRPLMVRERSDGFYSPWAWMVAHGVYDVVMLRLIPGLFLEIIMYWMVGLKKEAGYFFEFLLIANIFYLDVTLYMMTLGALFHDVSISILAGSAFIILNIGFGGFLLNLDTIPAVIKWVQWIAPLKYALEAVTQNEVKDLVVQDQLGSLPVNTSASLIAPGLFGLTGSYYRDLLVLALAFTLGYAALLSVSVWWRMRDRR